MFQSKKSTNKTSCIYKKTRIINIKIEKLWQDKSIKCKGIWYIVTTEKSPPLKIII